VVAFKAADVDRNGCVSTGELKIQIKQLLPGDELTSCDFKMLMMAFDVNRNGRIEQEEYVQAFVKAREN